VTEEEFLEALRDVADHVEQDLKGLSQKRQDKYVRDYMRAAEVFYALWYDGDRLNCWRIKGNTTREGKIVEMGAIGVSGCETAIYLRDRWGDAPTTLHA
jgi:hypothetical protein